ncbi:MAG: Ig domain-containing protein, partial [Abditibacteriota bacterium]|nr:Ig domain-containing protein [Abditibacteriota bacterium]
MTKAIKITVLLLFVTLLSSAGVFGVTVNIDTVQDLKALNTGGMCFGKNDVLNFAAGKTFDLTGTKWKGIFWNDGMILGNGATILLDDFQLTIAEVGPQTYLWGFVHYNTGGIQHLNIRLAGNKTFSEYSEEDSGGLLCAWNDYDGSIVGCSVDGGGEGGPRQIYHYSNYFGAIAGSNYGTIVEASVSDLKIVSCLEDGYQGLIAGTNEGGSIVRSVAHDCKLWDGFWNGGIVGYADGGTLTSCAVWNSDILSPVVDSCGGGFAGYAEDCNINISCVFKTAVKADYCGGLIGQMYHVKLNACYACPTRYEAYEAGGLLVGDVCDSEGDYNYVTDAAKAVGKIDGTSFSVYDFTPAEFTDGTLLTALKRNTTWYEGPDGFPVPIRLGTPVTGVSLDLHSVTLEVGKTKRLTAEVLPADATNKDLIWSSYDKTVAKVSSTGKITAIGPGSTTIRVKTKDGAFIDKCKVKVVEPSVAVTGVTLNKTSAKVEKGKTITLTATVAPEDATNQAVTWTSYDTSIATVTSEGKVKGIAPGTTTIRVKTKDGGFTAKCKVTVTQATVAVTGVALNKTVASVAKGKTFTLKAVVTPTNATNQNVTWSSYDTSIATVTSEGKVKGIAPGTTTIRVK